MRKYKKPEVIEKEVLQLNDTIAAACEILFDYRWANRSHETSFNPGDDPSAYAYPSKEAAYDASFNSITPPVSHSGQQGVVGPVHRIDVTIDGVEHIWFWEDYNADRRWQGSSSMYSWYPDQRYMHGLTPENSSGLYQNSTYTNSVNDNMQGVSGDVAWGDIVGPISGQIIRS